MISSRALSSFGRVTGRSRPIVSSPSCAGPAARRRLVGRRPFSAKADASILEDNSFNRERAAVKAHAAATSDLWRKLTLYVAVPLILIVSANTYRLWNEHWEHVAHEAPPEEKPQYQYLNIRSKAYPWGNGDKTLFWNDKVNYHKTD